MERSAGRRGLGRYLLRSAAPTRSTPAGGRQWRFSALQKRSSLLKKAARESTQERIPVSVARFDQDFVPNRSASWPRKALNGAIEEFFSRLGRFCDRSSPARPARLGFPVDDRDHPSGDDQGSRSPHLGCYRGLLAHHRPNRLVANPERSGQVAESAAAGFATDDRLLLGRELSSARGVV
jgi:hypothetical protein